MAIAIISDTQPKEYSGWLTESLEALEDVEVKGLALIALVNDENASAYTAYWHMNLADKAQAEQHLHYDVMDTFISANINRWLNPEDDCDDG